MRIENLRGLRIRQSISTFCLVRSRVRQQAAEKARSVIPGRAEGASPESSFAGIFS
jgi:hypothetical protein